MIMRTVVQFKKYLLSTYSFLGIWCERKHLSDPIFLVVRNSHSQMSVKKIPHDTKNVLVTNINIKIILIR